jgi:predicted nuclease with TOPRIM domain
MEDKTSKIEVENNGKNFGTYSIEKDMEHLPVQSPVDVMKEYIKMMMEMQARMDAMEAKTAVLEKDNEKLKKESETNKKKVEALQKDNKVLRGDNRKLKKESTANKGALGVLKNDNRKLKRNIAAMKVGEEGIEVIGGSNKTINYTKTGESDEGTVEKFSLGISRPDFGG